MNVKIVEAVHGIAVQTPSRDEFIETIEIVLDVQAMKLGENCVFIKWFAGDCTAAGVVGFIEWWRQSKLERN